MKLYILVYKTIFFHTNICKIHGKNSKGENKTNWKSRKLYINKKEAQNFN